MFVCTFITRSIFFNFEGRILREINLLRPHDSRRTPGQNETLYFVRINILYQFCDVLWLHIVCTIALSICTSTPKSAPQPPTVFAWYYLSVEQSFIYSAEPCVEEAMNKVPTILLAPFEILIEYEPFAIILLIRLLNFFGEVTIEVECQVLIVGEI